MRAMKPVKAGAALGVVDGDVTVTRAGNIVTVARTGKSSLTIDMTSADYAELHSGMVRNGILRVKCDGVIYRDIAMHGGGAHGCIVDGGVADCRFVRPLITGWGEANTTETPWIKHKSAGIAIPSGSADDCLVIGARIGAPRYPTNAWREYNRDRGVATDDKWHPWGAAAINHNNGNLLGGWHVSRTGMASPSKSLILDSARSVCAALYENVGTVMRS
ncbi:MAG: hypothetical protein CO096_30320 [Armatimonadetes bacterium CG_4_9_14_3_um_filter_66_14]|nr:MAG: hypothetical protein CO096_30320 [Armatimonadetes bacterium CG_4_9_14_3_um_filter_66_14]